MKKAIKKLMASLLVAALLLPSTLFIPKSIFLTKVNAIGSSIKVGTEITLGHYQGYPLKWICVLVDDNGPLMLAEDIICKKEYDAIGKNSDYHSDSWGYVREKNGSNCWEDSNIRQWLNSSGTVDYSHCPPSYADESGFMSNFTTNELSLVKNVSHIVTMVKYDSTRKGYCDGGKTDSFNAFSKDFNINNCFHKTLSDSFMLLDANQINAIYFSNPEYLKASERYFTACISGNNYACFDNTNSFDPKSTALSNYYVAGSTYGIRPAFYLNTTAIHKWSFNENKTAISCSHCDKIFYISPNKNFEFGKDNFSFPHSDVMSSAISYIGMSYVMPALKLDIFPFIIDMYNSANNYRENKKNGNNNGTWLGSCYGIACMDASFLSTLNVSNYGSSTVNGLSLDTKLRDSINIMLYSQGSFINGIDGQVVHMSTNWNKAAVSAAKSITSNGYLPVLTYDNHSVNIIGVLPDDFDNDYYILSIYDCNSGKEPKFIAISKDYKIAYSAKFNPDEPDELSPRIELEEKIKIKRVQTSALNSIDFWAPGLSTSPFYTQLSQISRVKKLSSSFETNSQNNEIQATSEDYIKFLLASDEEIVVTADDGSYFIYNNGEISETNIEGKYCEDIGDLGVTKVIIPRTASSYKIESNNQYYANINHDSKIAVCYCEKGGTSTFECNGIASVDTYPTGSYSELSCYRYDLIANSDSVGVMTSNSSSNTKIDFSNNNPIVETSDYSGLKINVQHNDNELSVENIEFPTENTEEITLKAERSGNIVAEKTSTQYTVTWSVDGKTTTAKYYEGNKIVKPADPTKLGYIFNGWSPSVPSTMPAKDLTFTAQFKKVVPKTLTQIKVETMPNKTTYTYKKDKFNPDGLTLKATYSDGSTEIIKDTSKMEFSGYSAMPKGTKTITVKYEGLETTFNVKVKLVWWQWIIKIVLFGWIWY